MSIHLRHWLSLSLLIVCSLNLQQLFPTAHFSRPFDTPPFNTFLTSISTSLHNYQIFYSIYSLSHTFESWIFSISIIDLCDAFPFLSIEYIVFIFELFFLLFFPFVFFLPFIFHNNLLLIMQSDPLQRILVYLGAHMHVLPFSSFSYLS